MGHEEKNLRLCAGIPHRLPIGPRCCLETMALVFTTLPLFIPSARPPPKPPFVKRWRLRGCLQVHCISTEFTPRKHGGEKGVPFRIQIDTFAQGDTGDYTEHLHSASCQIKVFKVHTVLIIMDGGGGGGGWCFYLSQMCRLILRSGPRSAKRGRS